VQVLATWPSDSAVTSVSTNSTAAYITFVSDSAHAGDGIVMRVSCVPEEQFSGCDCTDDDSSGLCNGVTEALCTQSNATYRESCARACAQYRGPTPTEGCCGPEQPYCVNTDCQGHWSACDSGCTRSFTITTPPFGGGAACPWEPPHCNHGEGQCSRCSGPNCDCLGSWSSCPDCSTNPGQTPACTDPAHPSRNLTWTEMSPQMGTGLACPQPPLCSLYYLYDPRWRVSTTDGLPSANTNWGPDLSGTVCADVTYTGDGSNPASHCAGFVVNGITYSSGHQTMQQLCTGPGQSVRNTCRLSCAVHRGGCCHSWTGATCTHLHQGAGRRRRLAVAAPNASAPALPRPRTRRLQTAVSQGNCSFLGGSSTAWQQQPGDTTAVYVDVQTTAYGLVGAPAYVTSVHSEGSLQTHFHARTGITAATSTGFRVYLSQATGTTLLANILSQQYRLIWIANQQPCQNAGVTPQGDTAWQQASADTVYVDIDTRSGAFASTPVYVVDLRCATGCWMAKGGHSVYSATPTGFRVYVQKPGVTVREARWDSRWAVNWLGQTQTPTMAGRGSVGSWQQPNVGEIYADVSIDAPSFDSAQYAFVTSLMMSGNSVCLPPAHTVALACVSGTAIRRPTPRETCCRASCRWRSPAAAQSPARAPGASAPSCTAPASQTRLRRLAAGVWPGSWADPWRSSAPAVMVPRRLPISQHLGCRPRLAPHNIISGVPQC
jgi:hypothetical protein